ncbi:hypothetical protein [Micromonospora sp. RP3T]|uniref:hypothetical protein n=1 Tax=Micromonospora sp. RP3T TaxID=2135446 RepID=UPI003D70FA45
MTDPASDARAYTPPRVTIQPPTRPWSTAPEPGTDGVVVRIILNTKTGDLHAEPSPPGSHYSGPYYEPARDLWIRTWGYERTPTRIGWDFTYGAPWMESSAATAMHLARIAGTAQALLDNLAPVPDTPGEWEWTPKATAAEERLANPGNYHYDDAYDPDAYWSSPLPDRCSYGVASVAELLDTCPEYADEAWVAMTDAELDNVAADLCGSPARRSGRLLPTDIKHAVLDRFHNDDRLGGNNGLPVCLVGGRTGLRNWRNAAISARVGLPAKMAAAHLALASTVVERLTATTSDPELEQLAAQLDADAALHDRVALVGTVEHLRRHRTALRERVRDELAVVAAQHAVAAAELQRLSAIRAGLLHQVVAFREPPEWPDGADEPSYAELGRLAGMTRQSAREAIRPTLPDYTRGDDARATLLDYIRGAGDAGVTAAQASFHLREVGALRGGTAATLLREMVDDKTVDRVQHGAVAYYRIREQVPA